MGCKCAPEDSDHRLSSFGNLKNLPPDCLKVDGTFIRNLASQVINQAMAAR